MSDPFGCAKFLLGVAWTDFVLWFFSNRVQVPEGRLDLVILLAIMITSGTLGFLPFERHIENENPIRGASVRFFLATTVVLIGLLILVLIHNLIMPQLLQPWHLSPLRIVLATVIPWSLIGIGLYVWRRIRARVKPAMLQTITSSESYIFLAVFAALALVALIYLLSPMSLPDEPLLYLIGVNHAVQFKDAATQMFPDWEPEGVRKKRAEFMGHVAEIIDKLGIEVLAEEFSRRESEERETAPDDQSERAILRAGLAHFNYETVLEQLSNEKGITHRFCDPNSKEREALGIEVDPKKATESDWRKREQVWLSCIADCKDKRVLFVCGDNHYDAFSQLLAANAFNVQHGPHYDISDKEFEGPRES